MKWHKVLAFAVAVFTVAALFLPFSPANVLQTQAAFAEGRATVTNWEDLAWRLGQPEIGHITISGNLQANRTLNIYRPVEIIGANGAIYRAAGNNFDSFFYVTDGCQGDGVWFTGDLTLSGKTIYGTNSTSTITQAYVPSLQEGHLGYDASSGWNVTIGQTTGTNPQGYPLYFVAGGNTFSFTGGSAIYNVKLYTASAMPQELKTTPTLGSVYVLGFQRSKFWYIGRGDTGAGGNYNATSGLSAIDNTSINDLYYNNWSRRTRYHWKVEALSYGGYYLRNVATNEVLVCRNNQFQLVPGTHTVTVDQNNEVIRDFQETDPFKNNGNGYFITNNGGKITLTGSVQIKDVNLNSTYRDTAPIVQNSGYLQMDGANVKIYNNVLGYYPDEANITSVNNADQTSAVTKTWYDAVDVGRAGNASNTGTAGAILMRGGTADIMAGTIGATSPNSDAARRHYARNNLKLSGYNGNKASAGAIIVSGGTMNIKANSGGGSSVIVGNTGAVRGTVQVVGNGTINFTQGTVIGNLNWIGGAVTATGYTGQTHGTFVMDGNAAVIDGNDTMQLGGGIMVASNNVQLKKGHIRYNTAWDCGGGIYVQGHASANARILRLTEPTNIFENIASSSGIDIGTNRSVSIHKEPTTQDKYYFGRAWQARNNNNRTNDYLNQGGKNNVNKYTTGSGGGMWLCPAGTVYVGGNRLRLDIGRNSAEVQGDDIMKDNGVDGGLLFGNGVNKYWNGQFTTDPPIKDGQGYTDTGNRPTGTDFFVQNYTSNQALTLKSKLTTSDVQQPTTDELNIYGNVARRGGGLGSDGTIILSEDPETINVVQAMLSIKKSFLGVTEQDVMIKATLQKEGSAQTLELGEFHLSDDEDTVFNNNDSLMEDELVKYERGYKVSFGIPQYVNIPGETYANPDSSGKYGEKLFDDNGNWVSDYKIVLTETDVNGNPITVGTLSQGNLTVESVTVDTKQPDQYTTVNYKTINLSLPAMNAIQPEVEKFINQKVHYDVYAPDNEVLTYEVMAYIPANAESFVITDTLQDELAFTDVNGAIKSGDAKAGNVLNQVRAFPGRSYDHDGSGSGSVAAFPDNNNADVGLLNHVTATINGQTLTIRLNTADISNVANRNKVLEGCWVRARFYAKIRDEYLKPLSEIAATQTKNGYGDISDTNDPARVYWRRITDNETVVNASDDHTGVENHADLVVNFGNEVSLDATSNTVTVKPELPAVEKYVNKTVHEELPYASDEFTYDIMAYVPAGANEVVIEDLLPVEVELVGQPTQFMLRTTNNHKGDGTGTVAYTSSDRFGTYNLEPPKRSGDSRLKITTQSNRAKITFTMSRSDDRGQNGDDKITHVNASDNNLFTRVFDTGKAGWIQLTFKARIKEAYRTQVIQMSRDQRNPGDYANMTSYPTVGSATMKNANWEKVETDDPLVNTEGLYPHAGVANTSTLKVRFENIVEIPSNTVTVRPNETEVEKYINDKVHADVHKSDETFVYDIMALIPAGVETFVIEDELPEELELVARGGGTYTSGDGKNALFIQQEEYPEVYAPQTYEVFALRASNDHSGDGNGTVADITSAGLFGGTTYWTQQRNGDHRVNVSTTNNRTKIRFTLERSDTNGGNGKNLSDRAILELADKNTLWVQLTFRVRYKSDYYAQALALAKEQAKNGYQAATQYPAVGSLPAKNATWNVISDNTPLLNTGAQTPHAGTLNEATASVTFTNNLRTEDTSNQVTVKPEEPTIEKYINNLVHDEIHQRSEVFTYDILAYVPKDAQDVTITDTLPAEVEMLRWDETSTPSNNGNGTAVFAVGDGTGSNVGRFALRRDNDHIGDGTGTVSMRNLSDPSYIETYPLSGGMTIGRSSSNVYSLTFALNRTDHGTVFDAIDANGGAWVQLTFKAKIKSGEGGYYDAVQKVAKEQRTEATYADVGNYNSYGLNKEAFWKKIATNDTVINADPVHNGVANGSHVSVHFTDGGHGSDDSNIVTVKPEEPEVEKYIENTVHHETHDPADTFDYAIMAYVPIGAKSLTITDPLPDAIDLYGQNGQVIANANVFNSGQGAIISATLLADDNNHNGNGTDGTVKTGTGRNLFTAANGNPTVLKSNAFVYDPTTRVLTVALTQDTFNAGYETFFTENNASGWGKWVRIVVRAKFKDTTYPTLLRAARSQITGNQVPAYYATVDGNGTVTNAVQPHTGVKNTATETVTFERSPEASVTSNTVTVKPEVPEVEKYINNSVHRDLHLPDEVIEYEIMAYIPQGATQFTIWDTLPQSLSLAKSDGTPTNDFREALRDLTIGNAGKYGDNNHYASPQAGNGVNSQTVGWEGGGSPLTNILTLNNDGNALFETGVQRPYNGSAATGDAGFIGIKPYITVKQTNINGTDITGTWVRARFYAVINPDYRDQMLHYTRGSADTVINWKTIDDDINLVKGNPAGETFDAHTGIANRAELTVDFANKTGVNVISNEVTTKVETPEVEKYINNRVHADLFDTDEVFTYQIMAYVPENTVSFTIEDYLPQSLEPVDSSGNAVTSSNLKDAFVELAIGNVADTYRNNNHSALPGEFTLSDGTVHTGQTVTWNAPVSAPYDLLNTEQFDEGYYTITSESFVEGSFSGQKISVTVNSTDLTRKDNSKVQIADEWVRLTIRARIKSGFADKVIAHNSADHAEINWKSIADDTPLVNTGYETAAHEGVVNKAGLTTVFANGSRTVESNEVTVKVEKPEIEKYVNKKVHDDLSAFDVPFTYDIIARIPAGAQTFVIEDTLPASLEMLREDGTAVSGTGDGTKVMYSDRTGSKTFDRFDLRSTNDHVGNGSGTVAKLQADGAATYSGTFAIKPSDRNNLSRVQINGGKRIVFTLDRQYASGSGVNLSDKAILELADTSEQWVHLTFDVRIKAGSRDDIAAYLKDQTNPPAGWDEISASSSNNDGYHTGNMNVINGLLPHKGTANQAALTVTGVNTSYQTYTETTKSNIVTVKPDNAALSVNKAWVDDGSNRPNATEFLSALSLVPSGRSGMPTLALSGATHSSTTGNVSVYTIDYTYGSDTYPLTIRLETGVSSALNPAIKEIYSVSVEGLPKLDGVAWSLREAADAFSSLGYVAPTYSPAGESAANGGMIINVKPDLTKRYVQVQKNWRNTSSTTPIRVKLHAYNGSTEMDWNHAAFSDISTVEKTIELNEENHWAGGWDNLPAAYTVGGIGNITYQVTEETTVSGLDQTIDLQEVIVSGNTAGYVYTITNAAPQIEKYINPKRDLTPAEAKENGNVHQDLTNFDDVFTYDVQAYMPADSDKLIIRDSLVDALAFSDRANAEDSRIVADPSGKNIGINLTVKNPDGSGKAPALNATANVIAAATLTDVTTAQISGQELTVTIDLTSASDDVKKLFRDRYVVVTFDAKIKDSYRTISALEAGGLIATVNSDTPIDDPARINQSAIVFTNHTGVANEASYSAYRGSTTPIFENERSNKVTVLPAELTLDITKTWVDQGAADKPTVDAFVDAITLHCSDTAAGYDTLAGTAFNPVAGQNNTYQAAWAHSSDPNANLSVTLTVTGTDTDSWELTFTGLPSLKGVSYYVTEAAFAAYSTTYENPVPEGGSAPVPADAAHDNGLIRNTRNVTGLALTKKWVDEDSLALVTRPDSITVTLEGTVNGASYSTQSITIPATANKAGDWTYSVQNLPVTNAAGEPVIYTVKEASFDVNNTNGVTYHYVPENEVVYVVQNGLSPMTATLTNRLETKLSIDKRWINDVSSNRPAELKVIVRGYIGYTSLNERGTQVYNTGNTVTTITQPAADTTNTWTEVIEPLPVYHYDSVSGTYQKITYLVEEKELPPRYTAENVEVMAVSGTDLTHSALLRNTLVMMPKQSLEITKTWVNDNDTLRPEEITLQLHAYKGTVNDANEVIGTLTDGYSYPRTITLNRSEVTTGTDGTNVTWTYQVGDLPEYERIEDYGDASKRLLYKLTETVPDGYAADESNSTATAKPITDPLDPTIITGSSDEEFLASVINTRHRPEIAKYVNVGRDVMTDADATNDDGGVHTELLNFDEVFTYDLQAYITEDAGTVELTDLLAPELEFARVDGGNTAIAESGNHTNIRVVLKDASGSVPALSAAGSDITTESFVHRTITTDAGGRQKLSVRIDIPNAQLNDYRGKYVQVTFNALIREEYRSLDLLQNSSSWTNGISDNAPVDTPKADRVDTATDSRTQGEDITSHNGLMNNASYGVWTVENAYSSTTAPTHEDTSNTVTVLPLTARLNVTKAWRKADDTAQAKTATAKEIADFVDHLILDRTVSGNVTQILPGTAAGTPTVTDNGYGTFTISWTNGITLTIDATTSLTDGLWRLQYQNLPKLTGAVYSVRESSHLLGYIEPFYTNTDPSVTGKAIEGGTIANTEEAPSIEKYVNPTDASITDGGVHTDLFNFDEVFTYDIQAYITPDADEVTITDTLNPALMLAAYQSGTDTITDVVTGQTYGLKVALKESNANGKAPALSSPGATSFARQFVADEDNINVVDARFENQVLTVKLTLPYSGTADARVDVDPGNVFRGKWVQITFNARIKDSYKSIEALKSTADVWADDITDNAPVNDASMHLITSETRTRMLWTSGNAHSGVKNDASYAIRVGSNPNAHAKASNTVTVAPLTTDLSFSKTWQPKGPAVTEETVAEFVRALRIVAVKNDTETVDRSGANAVFKGEAGGVYTYQWLFDASDPASGYEDVVLTVDASDPDTYQIRVEGLRRMEGVTYAIRENRLGGYDEPVYDNTANSTGYTDKAAEGGAIINRAQIEIEINKTWTGDSDAIRPDSITLTLTGTVDDNGSLLEITPRQIVIPKRSNEDQWSYKESGLPQYDDEGRKITYYIEELPLPGYDADVSGRQGFDAAGKASFTNTLKTVEVKLEKTWEEYGRGSDARPDTVTFTVQGYDSVTNELLSGDAYTVTEPVPVNKALDQTTHTFTKLLPKFTKDGHEIRYEVTEETVPGYEEAAGHEDPAESNGYTAKLTNNKKDDTKIKLTLIKHWQDGGDTSLRPATVSFTLTPSEPVDLSGVTGLQDNGDGTWQITLSADTDMSDATHWSKVIEGLPRSTNAFPPQEITYTVKEDETAIGSPYVARNLTEQFYGADSTLTFTNRREGKVVFTARKEWEGDTGEETGRPTQILVSLIREQDNTEVDTVTIDTPEKFAEFEGSGVTFAEQNLYDPDGSLYTYTITETMNDNGNQYLAQYQRESDTSWLIKNTYKVPGTISIKAIKQWENLTPSEDITFTLSAGNYDLKANGIETRYTMHTNGTDTWELMIPNLRKYVNGHDGEEIEYELREEASSLPAGYALTDTDATSFTGDEKEITFTNTYTAPETVRITAEKQWEGETDLTSLQLKLSAENHDLAANGIQTSYTMTKNALGEWKMEINDLPKLTNGYSGEVINYTLTEIVPEGYTLKDTIVSEESGGKQFTFLNAPEKVSISVSKIWDDPYATKRPDSIIIHLLRNGTRVAQKTMTGPDFADLSFDDLDKYSSVTGSTKILNRYTVEEEMTTNAASYLASIEQPAADGSNYTAKIKNSAVQASTASTVASTASSVASTQGTTATGATTASTQGTTATGATTASTQGTTSTGASTTASTGKTSATGASTGSSLPTRGATSVINQIRTTPQDNVKSVHKLTAEEAGSALGQLRNMVRDVLTNDPTSLLYPVLLLISMGGLPFLVGITKKKDDDDDHDPDGGGKKTAKKNVEKKNGEKKTVKKDAKKKAAKKTKKKEEPKIRLNVH